MAEFANAVSLPFSIPKLVLVVVWFYLCLYFTQKTELSPLVPDKHKSFINLLSLILGPLLFGGFLITDTVKKYKSSSSGFVAVITEQLRWLTEIFAPFSKFKLKHSSKIKLMDSSGRNITEILGHGSKEDSQILQLTTDIISNALDENASDILIDPKDENNYTVRFRVDGVIRTIDELNSETCKAVINSIKAVSSMDIGEKRRPQDGAFIAKTLETTSSFRVASAGVVNGEKLAIRVLNQFAGNLTLLDLGISKKQLAVLEKSIEKPNGMILMCGPTGSGKTTTLYAILNQIDRFTRNVVTVEDPIECVMPNTSQIEVNPKADITFAKALRSILRQDPDVICVGEIRDEETASIALRAAQTGHLVLATVHCNSNASAMVRLLDLGISPLLMTAGLNVLVSQRLLRMLCPKCKQRAQLEPSKIEKFTKEGVNYKSIFEASGCSYCHDTGYIGRTGVYDILVLDDALKSKISKSEMLITEMRKNGDKKGVSNLRSQAMKKVLLGITSLEEVNRVIGEE